MFSFRSRPKKNTKSGLWKNKFKIIKEMGYIELIKSNLKEKGELINILWNGGIPWLIADHCCLQTKTLRTSKRIKMYKMFW